MAINHWLRRGRFMACAGLAALTLTNCTSTSGTAVIREAPTPDKPYQMKPDAPCLNFSPGPAGPAATRTDREGDTVAFPGLLRGSGGEGGVRYIFHTHGMGLTNRCDFANDLFRHLIDRGYRLDPERPGLSWTPTPTREHHIRGEGLDCSGDRAGRPPCKFSDFGEYRIDNLVGPGGVRLRVWTYYWHASLWSVQEPYVRADLALNPGLISRSVKRNTIDGGLGDAAAYLGEMGPVVREGMGETICLMLRDLAGADSPKVAPGLRGCLTDAERRAAPVASLNFLSHSLGSRMLFDVLGGEYRGDNAVHERPAEENPDEVAVFELLRTRESTFFMAANQLPLLGPGRVRRDPPRGFVDDACSSLPAYLRARCLPRTDARPDDRTAPLNVVGFVDPGDLLGYRVNGGVLPGSYGDRLKFTVVEHRNAPQILWLGTWPLDAHDRELESRSASALILCGGVTRSEGDGAVLRPRICGGRP